MAQTNDSKPGVTEFWMAALIALSLLVLLSPLPRPRAVSETPWFGEFATTLALAICLAYSYVRGCALFAIGDTETRRLVRFFSFFVLWSAASAVWARSPYLTVHHVLVWTEYLLFFLFIRARLASGDEKLVPNIFAIVSIMLGLLCLIEYVTLPDFKALEGVIRLRYGAYSELLVTIVPLLWAFAIAAVEAKRRAILIAAAVLGWTVVMLSLSKGAFLAGLVGTAIAFLGIFFFGKQRRRTIVFAAIWIALTIAVQAGFSLLSPVPATVDYISGKADVTRETSLARVFVWKVGARMVKLHPVLGVGADNFGISFNDARTDRRLDHPADPNDEPVSDNLVERAHNEPLEVFAELGIIGLVLFIIPFLWFGYLFLRGWRTASPVLWAAAGGMIAFFASSMVSSFSFRLSPNGIAFFVVLAVAMNELRRPDASDQKPSSKFVLAAAAMFCAVSLIIFGLKGYAEQCVRAADREPDIQSADALYERAARLDPAYGTVFLNRASRYSVVKDDAKAAGDIRRAIDKGCGVVITYNALAESYEKAGDLPAAEQAFNEALTIFPRSVFLRVRFAKYLLDHDRSQDSQQQLDAARSIDKRQADGWYNLLTIGSVRAFYAARENANLAAPAELLPEAAVIEYLDEPIGKPFE